MSTIMYYLNTMKTLKTILKKYGLKNIDISKKLGLDRAAVNRFMKKGIPSKYALFFEEITQGEIKAVQILENKLRKKNDT